jgi:hypothetical protein
MRPSKLVRDLQRPDAPGMVEERLALRKISEQAVREREKKYPVLNEDNALEAIEWQRNLIDELYREWKDSQRELTEERTKRT